jgi:transcriptional antiterminator
VVAVRGCKIALLIMDVRILIRIDEQIKTKQTGTPKQLAQKLEISERSIHYYIAFMKNEMKAPIVYDNINETYLYETECKLCFVG